MEPINKHTILLPKYDVSFKRIFSELDIVEDFLRKVLDIPDEEKFTVTIQDRELIARTENEKVAILDVRVHMDGKADIDIEVQVCKTPDIQQRLIYYGAKMISSQLERGQRYDTMKQTIIIVITEFPFIYDSAAWHNSYVLYDPKTKSKFTDMLRYDIVELRKLPESEDGSAAWEWAKFFKANSEEEFQMLAEGNEKIDKAVKILKELSDDKVAQIRALNEEMVRMDYDVTMRAARKEGLKEGKEESAVAALKEGLPLDVVARITGLPSEDIKALQENINRP